MQQWRSKPAPTFSLFLGSGLNNFTPFTIKGELTLARLAGSLIEGPTVVYGRDIDVKTGGCFVSVWVHHSM